MTDFDKLDRLAKLRNTGALSQKEFDREKARILADDEPALVPTPDRHTPTSKWLRYVAIGGVLLLLIGASLYFLMHPPATISTVANGAADATETPGTSSIWTISHSVDPMTDEAVDEAGAILSGNNLNVETAIICKADGVTYRFRLFDKAGKPAEMQVFYGQVRFKMRVGDNPAQDLLHGVLYRNQANVTNEDGDVPRAQQITAQFETNGGEDTVRIDQADPALRAMLDTCIQRLDSGKSHAPQGNQQQPAAGADNTRAFPVMAPDEMDRMNEAIESAFDNAEAAAP